MKKIIAILTVALMLLGSLNVYAADTSLEKMYIFVKAGAENGDGSKEMPFGTFEEARDRIREIKKNGEYPAGGIVVYFREGVYSVTSTINLTEEDSGTAEGPVVYRSYMEEQVSFVGGIDLDVSAFSQVTDEAALARINSSAKDSIVAANLKDLGLTDYGELNIYGMGVAYFTSRNTKLTENGVHFNTQQPPEIFFGDDIGKIARFPNEGYSKTGEIVQQGTILQLWSHHFETYATYVPYEERVYPPEPSIYYVDAEMLERMKTWKNEDDIWVYGTFGETWSDISLPVREYDSEKGIITTEFPSPKPILSNMNYYIYNILGELDAPGEYYLDRNTGVLYIYPTDRNGKITFSNLNESLFNISNASNIEFKSLIIKGTRKNAITVKGCDNIRFELCSISKVAGIAAECVNCTNTAFISCHIYLTGKGGIEFTVDGAESQPGRKVAIDALKNLTPQNNVVENCEINDYARIKATYSPAVAMSGVGNIVRHSKIYNADHYAISDEGRDDIIENNEFTNILRTADDSGAIYRSFGKEKRGLIIRNNYFHDINSTSKSAKDIAMVYPDDTASEWYVYQNLVVNTTGRLMRSNGGDSHEVINNIVINNGGDFASYSNHAGSTSGKYSWERYSNVVTYKDNPAYAKYKNFSDLNTDNYLIVRDVVMKNNVSVNGNAHIASKADASLNSMDPVYEIAGDPGFVDMENGNYTLKEDSSLYKKFSDFQAPDFENMGMYTGKLQALLGANKAFYVGSPKVYDGWNVEYINQRFDASPVIKDGAVYLPVRYITEDSEGEVSYDANTGEITVNYATPVIIKPDEYIEMNGTALVSTEMIADIFDKQVKVFENGVILMGEDIRIEDTDTNILAELARRLDNE